MSDEQHIGEVRPRAVDEVKPTADEIGGGSGDIEHDDFELPAKACDLGRPEGCESCQ